MNLTKNKRAWVVTTAVLAGVAATGASTMRNTWKSLGKKPAGAHLERLRSSNQFEGRRFTNPLAVEEDVGRVLKKWVRGGSPHREPSAPIPVVASFLGRSRDRAEGLGVTWIGHSTLLLVIDGVRILTDPVWSERVSPFESLGSKRFFAPPLSLEEIGEIDAIVISHDHYDHLDRATIEALATRRIPFVVPLGVGSHLEYWGVEPGTITELDWWQSQQIAGVELVATPARHFSGRYLADRDATLWSGWAFLGPEHRAYYSGDTGFFPGFAEIGRRLGPFDLSLIEIGAYDETWADVHLGPEQALEAHLAVGAEVLMPVHWGTFNLALHGWTEPVERLLTAAAEPGARVVIPRPGETLAPLRRGGADRWWPELPWQTAEEHPVRSSKRASLDTRLVLQGG